MPRLKLLSMSKWNEETTESIVEILSGFAKLCSLEDHREPHAINQAPPSLPYLLTPPYAILDLVQLLLFNYDVLSEIITLLGVFHKSSSHISDEVPSHTALTNKGRTGLVSGGGRWRDPGGSRDARPQGRLQAPQSPRPRQRQSPGGPSPRPLSRTLRVAG